MKNRILFVFLAVTLVVSAVLFGACSATPAEEGGVPPAGEEETTPEVIELTYAGYLAPDHVQEAIAAWYAEELEERTDGRVKLTCYHGQTLGNVMDFPEMLRGGVCDMTLLAPPQPEFLGSIWEVAEFPFTTPEDMVLSEEAFYLALHEGLLESFLAPYKVMWYQPTPGTYLFLRDKKVTCAEDFEGLKVSGISGVWVELPEQLGATGVATPGPEVFMSLDRGIVDARFTMPDFVLSQKLYEVVEYAPWYAIRGSGGFLVAMTKERWNSLPTDVQLVMEQLNTEARYEWLRRFYITPNQYRAEIEKVGIEVYDLPEEEMERWRTELESLVEEQIEIFETKGPARELLELFRYFREAEK